MGSWIVLQASSGVMLDSQILGALFAALLTGMLGWMAWLTVQQIRLMILASRVQPIVDAIYKDLPAIAKLTNPVPYTDREQSLIDQWDDEERRDRMTGDELEELRKAYDAKQKDNTESAAYRLVAALQQAAVRGELDARKKRQNPIYRLLWAFR